MPAPLRRVLLDVWEEASEHARRHLDLVGHQIVVHQELVDSNDVVELLLTAEQLVLRVWLRIEWKWSGGGHGGCWYCDGGGVVEGLMEVEAHHGLLQTLAGLLDVLLDTLNHIVDVSGLLLGLVTETLQLLHVLVSPAGD